MRLMIYSNHLFVKSMNDTQFSKNTPKVSVIIPFYSNVKWLEEAVDSVLKQQFTDYEIIVVNDGSNEDISEFLAKYRNKIEYFYKENGGAASARNLGIKEAKGEYVAFLDSDDLWRANKLSLQISKMIEYNAVWSYTDFEIFGDKINNTLKRMSEKEEGLYDFVSPYIGTPTVIIKREEILLNDLFFDESIKFGEDSILWNRLINNYTVLYINQNLSGVRIRGNNAGRRAAVQIRARVKVYDKCVEKIPNFKRKRSVIFKTAIFFCRFGCLFVKSNSKSRFNEFIAKCFFLFPYLLFKMDKIFWKK